MRILMQLNPETDVITYYVQSTVPAESVSGGYPVYKTVAEFADVDKAKQFKRRQDLIAGIILE